MYNGRVRFLVLFPLRSAQYNCRKVSRFCSKLGRHLLRRKSFLLRWQRSSLNSGTLARNGSWGLCRRGHYWLVSIQQYLPWNVPLATRSFLYRLGWRWAFIVQIPLFALAFLLISCHLTYVTPVSSSGIYIADSDLINHASRALGEVQKMFYRALTTAEA